MDNIKNNKFEEVQKITREFVKLFLNSELNLEEEELKLAIEFLKKEILYKLNTNSKKTVNPWGITPL